MNKNHSKIQVRRNRPNFKVIVNNSSKKEPKSKEPPPELPYSIALLHISKEVKYKIKFHIIFCCVKNGGIFLDSSLGIYQPT